MDDHRVLVAVFEEAGEQPVIAAADGDETVRAAQLRREIAVGDDEVAARNEGTADVTEQHGEFRLGREVGKRVTHADDHRDRARLGRLGQRGADIAVHRPYRLVPLGIRDELVEQPAAGVHSDHRGEAEADQRQRLRPGAAAQIDGCSAVFAPRQAEFREQRGLPVRDLVDVSAQHPGVVLGEQAVVVGDGGTGVSGHGVFLRVVRAARRPPVCASSEASGQVKQSMAGEPASRDGMPPGVTPAPLQRRCHPGLGRTSGRLCSVRAPTGTSRRPSRVRQPPAQRGRAVRRRGPSAGGAGRHAHRRRGCPSGRPRRRRRVRSPQARCRPRPRPSQQSPS